MTASTLLVRDVELAGRRVDVTCAGSRISAIDPAGSASGADVVIGGAGAALLPGLHDHHIHLLAAAAALASVDCGALASEEAFATALRRAPGPWVRAVGYHESLAGPLDRWVLDRLAGDRPVRVQHASGGLWVLSSAAVAATGLERDDLAGIERDERGRATGRLWRLDEWLRSRLPTEGPDLAPLGSRLRDLGITGVTDATPTEDPGSLELLARAVRQGALRCHVQVTGGPGLAAPAPAELRLGPVKLLLPDHDPPLVEALTEAVRAARAAARAVAVHCVTAEALVLTLAALDTAGARAGDRIEHGAVVLPALLPQLAALGVTVVTQPAMIRARGDRYRAEVEPAELPHLWPCRSLLEARIPMAAGTDAPFGPLDPWVAIDAAANRTTASGAPLGSPERIDAHRALQLFLGPLEAPGGPPRHVEVGERADLCLLDRPLHDALRAPSAQHVAATVIGGEVV